jgi:hypothetical protein
MTPILPLAVQAAMRSDAASHDVWSSALRTVSPPSEPSTSIGQLQRR